MDDRSIRLQIVRNELDLSLEFASVAARAAAEGNARRLGSARKEAQEALDTAVQTLAGVDGICEAHLRPLRAKVSQADRQLSQLRDAG